MSARAVSLLAILGHGLVALTVANLQVVPDREFTPQEATTGDARTHLTITETQGRMSGPGVKPSHVELSFTFVSDSYTECFGEMHVDEVVAASGKRLAATALPMPSAPALMPWQLADSQTDGGSAAMFFGSWSGDLPALDIYTVRGSVGLVPRMQVRMADVRPADFGAWLSLGTQSGAVRVTNGSTRLLIDFTQESRSLISALFAFDALGNPLPVPSFQFSPDSVSLSLDAGLVKLVRILFIDPTTEKRVPFEFTRTWSPQPSPWAWNGKLVPASRPPVTRVLPSCSLADLVRDHPERGGSGTSPAGPSSGTPDREYLDALLLLAAGCQRDCEEFLSLREDRVRTHADLAFLQGTLQRSRFDVQGAAPWFQLSAALDPTSVRARCCGLVQALDGDTATEKDLGDLVALARSTPSDPLLFWLVGIECRQHHATDVGIWAYTALLRQMSPGPALLHQTFANLLDEAGRSEEALPHRHITIALEDAPWSESGLGDTLERLERYADAAKAYEAAVHLDPTNADNWSRWGEALAFSGDDAGAAGKAGKALALDPTNLKGLADQVVVAEHENDARDAIAKLKHILSVYPTEPWALAELQRLSGSP